MQLTPALEQEIHEIMEDYWNSYFTGNLERWASYLPDDYRNIGTTQEEIWSSKQDIVVNTLRVLDQTVRKADFRDKTLQIIPYSSYFMVQELAVKSQIGEGTS